MSTQHVCIKVSNLRKIGYDNLRDWLEDDNNVYVGRFGRIFITEDERDDDGKLIKKIFHYKGSKWANPFKVTKECPVEQVLELYESRLDTDIDTSDMEELKGKNLGCFCNQDAPCHAKILADRVNKL